VSEEEDPKQVTTNKNFVPKVMILCAVARPRWDPGRNCQFDGKIGMWPFAEQAPARRASRNRAQGMLEWKGIKVTREVSTQYLLDCIIPAIKDCFPAQTGQFGFSRIMCGLIFHQKSSMT